MILDTQLELLPWESHVGTGIGGVPPTSYGTRQLGLATEFFTSGPPYADWLAAVHRPVLPNSGGLSLSFILATDSSTPDDAQALEFDTRLSIGNWNYNFSSQFNYQEGGMWQIIDRASHWADTGFKPGKFAPGTPYRIRIDYQFSTASRIGSILGIRLNDQRFLVPTTMQNLPPTLLNWADSASLQIQLDLNSSGGAYSIYLRDIQYEWS
ncbi:MAG: hypothetical protein WA463_11030 [Terriglobales bacterium]